VTAQGLGARTGLISALTSAFVANVALTTSLIVALHNPAEVSMCLAFPGRVLSIDGDFAKVDFGEGTAREGINVSLVEVKPGQYVLVHAGYAIQVMDEEEAQKTLSYWREILAYEQESGFSGR
jgi:hydrogenase expression/formation protein HypC